MTDDHKILVPHSRALSINLVYFIETSDERGRLTRACFHWNGVSFKIFSISVEKVKLGNWIKSLQLSGKNIKKLSAKRTAKINFLYFSTTKHYRHPCHNRVWH